MPTSKQEKGRFQRTRAVPKRGRYIRSSFQSDYTDLALDATLRAAAPFVLKRPSGPLVLPIMRQDWRGKIRTQKTGTLFIFVVDASGSMGTRLMSQTKAAILNLLDKAYKDRSEAALVAFKSRSAELLLPPTKSICLAEKKLRDLPTGGTTPLSAGLSLGYKVARKALNGARKSWPCMVLVTDGRINVGMDATGFANGVPPLPLYEEAFAVARKVKKEKRIRTLVIDTEEKHPGTLDMAKEIARHMGAKYIAMENLHSNTIVQAVME